MKKLNIILLLFFVFSLSFGQENKISLNHSQQGQTNLTFELKDYELVDANTRIPGAKIVTAEGLSAIMKKSAPDLPKFSTSIIIPDAEKMEVKILSSEYTEYRNIEIAPSKGNLLRTINPSDVPYEYGEVYQKDAFFPGKLASLQKPFILRDFRGQVVQVFPFQYNPVTKILRVYTKIEVEVYANGVAETNILERPASGKITKDFENIYQRHFINYNTYSTRYTPVDESGSMLIICYDNWVGDMQAFVDWKNTIGRPTEIVSVTDAGGTADAIKNYVQNYYDTHGLNYLLLVGDASQVPTNSGAGLGGDSDNAYGYLAGNDHYQEVIVGRFSAESVADVNTMVTRTIDYEDGSLLDNGWLNKALFVGSEEGAGQGDDGETDWQHLRNIKPDLEGFTYNPPSFEYFDGTQGAPDDAGDPSPADVATGINTGAGIINYCGHGADTSWVSSGFSVSDVDALTNENHLPFIFDVACVNGNFVNQTCFAESWLRATSNGQPTGAIAIGASTINQSWAPPMIAQDEMNDILVGISTTAPNKRTFGGIFVNGLFQMGDESADWDMLDTWTVFGDPSLYVRTDNPAPMLVNHDNVLVVGATEFTVSCDFDGALATLSKNGTIIGSATVSGGSAQIPVSGVSPGDVLTLAVVGFNKITYLNNGINAIAPNGAYMVVDSYNNSVDYGQSINLDMVLNNVGNSDATNVTAGITTNDPYATLTNTSFSYGDVTAGSLSNASSGAFTLQVANDVPDQHAIPVSVSITDGNDTWTSTVNIIANAPAIDIDELFVINDDNNNALLDPGETGDIGFTISNTGHAGAVFNGNLSIVNDPNNYLSLGNVDVSNINIPAGGSQDFVFTGATADANTPPGSTVGLQLDVTAGTANQYTASTNPDMLIGIIPIYPISAGGTLTVCTGTFYDSGLDTGNYDNNEDYTITFLPPPDQEFVVVDFTSFNIESGYDFLYVHLGADTSAPEMQGSPFTGSISPGTIQSATGITFHFTSDNIVDDAGWIADVSCYTPTSLPDCPTTYYPADQATNIFPTQISWNTVAGVSSYEVYFGTDTNPLNNTPVSVTVPEFSINPLPNTTYYWMVLPTNSVGTATSCNTLSFTTGNAQYMMTDNTTVNTCNAMFYDQGGPANDYAYSLDQTMTFFPDSSDSVISADFLSFDVELGSNGEQYDYLEVYDGADTSAPLIGKFSGNNTVPAELHPVTATNSDGALTFVFHSDGFINQAGWEAEISCITIDAVDEYDNAGFQIYPNPNTGKFMLLADNLEKNTSVQIYTAGGKLIYNAPLNEPKQSIDLSGRAKGVYFVKIASKNRIYHTKIIIR